MDKQMGTGMSLRRLGCLGQVNVCNKSRRSGEIPNDQEKANAMPLRKGNKEMEQRHYKLLNLT